MKKLYLDVDGVFLTKKNTQAAENVDKLLNYILPRFDCYWLTTHCHGGDSSVLLDMLSTYFPQETLCKLRKIKPSTWDTLKTEAIDFESDFYWIDDYVFQAEKRVLKQHNCLDRLVLVDLSREKELINIVSTLDALIDSLEIEEESQ